jgi:hypothetical protein
MSRFSDQPHFPGSRTRLAAWEDRLASLGSMLKGIVGWGLVPLSLLLMLLIVATQADSVLLASQGNGTPGQFAAERRECSARGGGCSWYGSFTADDGSVRLTDALLDDDPSGWAPGSAASVIWTGSKDPAAVYRPGDSMPLLLASGLGLLAVLGLVAWAVALTSRARNRPYPRWVNRLQGLVNWD